MWLGEQADPDALDGFLGETHTHAGQAIAARTGLSNDTVTTLISDHQGTTHHQITNSTGELSTSWQDPYGQPRGQAPASWTGQRGFVGGTKNASGLTRVGVRDYDPMLGRFVTVDPVQDLADPLQWNPYLYANNTPITKADPTGENWIFCANDCRTPAEKKEIRKQKTRYNKARQNAPARRNYTPSSPRASSRPASRPANSPSIWRLYPEAPGKALEALGSYYVGLGQGLLRSVPALLEMAVDPVGSGIRTGIGLADLIATNGVDGAAVAMWNHLAEPYITKWSKGDYAGAIGHAVGEFLPEILLGGKGLGRAASLARTARTAKAAAEAAAASARAQGGRIPTATAAAVESRTGRVFIGHSGERLAVPESLRSRLPNPSREPWSPTNCAEVAACSRAIDAGANLDDLVVHTVRTRTGAYFPPCLNCQAWLPGGD